MDQKNLETKQKEKSSCDWEEQYTTAECVSGKWFTNLINQCRLKD